MKQKEALCPLVLREQVAEGLPYQKLQILIPLCDASYESAKDRAIGLAAMEVMNIQKAGNKDCWRVGSKGP